MEQIREQLREQLRGAIEGARKGAINGASKGAIKRAIKGVIKGFIKQAISHLELGENNGEQIVEIDDVGRERLGGRRAERFEGPGRPPRGTLHGHVCLAKHRLEPKDGRLVLRVLGFYLRRGRQSDVIRRNQTQSDVIRRNQTTSDAIRRHQEAIKRQSRGKQEAIKRRTQSGIQTN